MAAPPLSREAAQQAIAAVEDALRKGYRPKGTTGSGHGAIAAAALSLGVNRHTFDARLTIAWDSYGIAPDWSLYQQPTREARMPMPAAQRQPVPDPQPIDFAPLPKPEAPPIQKPRYRVPAWTAAKIEGDKYRVLAIGDAHDAPKIPKDRFSWFGRLAAEMQPDWIVQIGDLLTLDSLNTHIPDETSGGRLKGTFLDDITSGIEALTAFGAEYDGPARKHVVLGNHENRLFLFEDQAPATAGMMQFELSRLLERFGWKWSIYGEYHFIGGVGFVHVPLNTLGRAYGGKGSASNIGNDATFDVVWGHDHRPMQRTIPKLGPSNFLRVVNLGCALPDQMIEAYAGHSLTGWGWCVWDLTIFDGHIQSAKMITMAELEERFA